MTNPNDRSNDTDSNQQETAPFEPGPDALVLAEHAESIRRIGRKIVADVIEIGRRLCECKRIVGHGNWLSWMQREFGWSERTARNFVSAYELSQSKSADFADLAIDLSSLYLLASPSTPGATRDDILRRIRGGEDLPFAEVKSIVSAAREDKVVQSGTEAVQVDRLYSHTAIPRSRAAESRRSS